MTVEGLEVSRLGISKSQPLLQILAHLFDLPRSGVIFHYVDYGQMDTGRDQIAGLFAFLFHDDHGDFARAFDGSDEFSDLDCFVFAGQWHRDLSIDRRVCLKLRDLGSLAIDKNDRFGFNLTNRMIASAPADFNQIVSPIPAIGDDIGFTRNGKMKISDHPVGNPYFGMEVTASLGPLSMTEAAPKAQNKVLINGGLKGPLVTKDIGYILGMILVRRTIGDLFLIFWAIVSSMMRKPKQCALIRRVSKSRCKPISSSCSLARTFLPRNRVELESELERERND
jgi:hypothetical protein